MAYPNYLAYSNELVGGPKHTYRLMSDANSDWGQSLIKVRRYLEHDRAQTCWFAYRVPRIELRDVGIPCAALQGGLRGVVRPPYPSSIEGMLLVSTNEIDGQAWGPGELNPYQEFSKQIPDSVIANTVLVFHGKFDISLASALNHAPPRTTNVDASEARGCHDRSSIGRGDGARQCGGASGALSGTHTERPSRRSRFALSCRSGDCRSYLSGVPIPTHSCCPGSSGTAGPQLSLIPD